MSNVYTNLELGLNPAALYRLGEASGPTAADSSGNNLNGAYSSTGVTYGQSGPITGDSTTAVLLDGTAGHIDCPSGVTTNGLSGLTLVAWIKPSNVTFSTTPNILANDRPGVNHKGAALLLQASGAGFNFNLGNGSTNVNLSVTYALSASTWYFVVATLVSGTMTIYVNGVAQTPTGTFTGTVAPGSSNFGIGYNSNATNNYFPGTVANVAVIPSGITAAEVTELYNTALASNPYLYTVNTGMLVQATDFNEVLNILQQPAGGQELGGYVLSGNTYTSNCTVSVYIATLSKYTPLVSVTVDTSDITPPGYFGTMTVNHRTSHGFQIYSIWSSAQAGGAGGGKYTVQY